jgi:hypothetical protein
VNYRAAGRATPSTRARVPRREKRRTPFGAQLHFAAVQDQRRSRKLSGDDAEWVVLDIVHVAVNILLDLNDDPTHLFGYHRGEHARHVLLNVMPGRLSEFLDHLNRLFSISERLLVPHASVRRSRPGRFST